MEFVLVIRWLAVYLFLFAAGLPIAATLCPRLADRGAGVALPLSLAVIGLVAYWIGHLSFGYIALGAGLLALGGLITIIRRRGGVTIERRPAIETAIVFSLAFSFLIAIRAVDPAIDPIAGEKFLDFSLLRSLLRADALPPQDVWFAGKPVKYYYGGHMLAALLTELTFTEARYAYNLALAGFYAMLVSAAYGLAGSIGAAIGAPRQTASALGAFFVGFASNLQTAMRAILWVLPPDLARTIVSIVSGAIAISPEDLLGSPSEFFYWSASRVIPGTVNEFPLFAWLNGDLHAHMMSTPFMLLAATLCFSYFRTPEERRARRWVLLCTIASLAGLIAVINTWSFPTVFGLTWLTLAFAPADPLSLLPSRFFDDAFEPRTWLGRELRWTGGALCIVIGLAAVGVLASLPFWFGTASGRAIALFPERSSFWSLLIVHGGFLLAFVPFLIGHARSEFDRKTLQLGIGLLAIVGAIAILIQFAALVLIAPLAVVTWVLLRKEGEYVAEAGSGKRPGVGFPAVLALAGAGLVLLVEVAYIQERAGPGRYNTVFKTYMQVWVLWSPAAGAALARIARSDGPTLAETPFRSAERASVLPGGISLSQVFVLLVVLSTSIYGSLALADHFASVDDPTLDGLAYVKAEHPEEAAAIFWLANRSGQPVVAAAPGVDSYSWTNPESSLTGLPTIAGWIHEIGYRNATVYYERVEDVDAIFSGPPARTVEMLRNTMSRTSTSDRTNENDTTPSPSTRSRA